VPSCELNLSIFTSLAARLRSIRQQSVVNQAVQSLYLQVSHHLLNFVVCEYSSTRADQLYGSNLQRLLLLIYRWFCRRHSLVS
jgi:hypothetical protein